MGEKSGKNVRRQHIKRVFMDNKRNIFIYALQKTIPVMVGYLFLGMAYGISMLEKYSGTGSRKPYLIFGLTDETFSVICAEKVPEHMDRGKLHMLITLFDQCYWVLGTLLGCAAGRLVTFNSTGLDFALTALAAGTILTRFLPFLLFPTAEKTPPFVTWLGEKLPYASMGQHGPAGRLLLKRYFDHHRFPRHPGMCRRGPHSNPAGVEKKCAVEHRRGDGLLYAAGSVRIFMICLVPLSFPANLFHCRRKCRENF